MPRKDKYSELENKIEHYFLTCDEQNKDLSGKKKIVRPYTLSGLISFIGITRDEFDFLSKSRRYRRVIECAKSRIEAFIEENMLTGELSYNASLNSLKISFGWGEKKDDTAEGGDRQITVTLSPEISNLAG